MKTRQKTIGILVEWILLHRKGDAFRGDTREDLINGIEQLAKDENLLYALDDDVRLSGIVTFIPDREHSILLIRDILVTKHSALKTFAQQFNRMFPGYCIIANRNNDMVQYDTPRLINHLLNIERN